MKQLFHLATVCAVAALSGFSSAYAAQSNEQVSQSVLADINKARQELSNTEQRIAKAQQQLYSQYQTLQQDVRALRQKTAVARRGEDETTLGLNQLTARLKSWQDQQTYQRNQLSSFIRAQHLANPADADLTGQLDTVLQFAATLKQSLYPNWQQQQIIQQNGELVSAQVLTAGPVSWFWQDNAGGIVDAKADNRIALRWSDTKAFEQLKQGKAVAMRFDPSLNKTLQRNQQKESALSHISKGGIWALPILAFALVAFVIAAHKAWQLWRLPAVVTSGLRPKARPGASMFEQQLHQCTGQFAAGQQRDDALFNVLQHSKMQLDARLGAIAVTAAVAPLLGLLGTVSGMIETFNMMTLFGSGDPQIVSGGIAQALITTELGLVVAIPALVLNALLSRKARHYYQQLESLALSLSQLNVNSAPAQATGRAA